MKKSNRRSSQQAVRLFDHIRELQRRFLTSFALMIIAGIVVYFFYDQIIIVLRAPLDAPLYYNTPAGSFAFVMKVCFMGALMFTIPFIIYNIIMFIQPAFEKKINTSKIYKATALSSLLSFIGVAFAYYLVLPGSLRFFGDFKVTDLHALISADSYLSFVTNIIITFIIVFQLPLVISFIDYIKPLNPRKLFKFEKWVVIFSLVISLLMPFAFDLMTTIFVAAPIIILYNFSILIVLVQHKRGGIYGSKAVVAEPKINQKNSFIVDENKSIEFANEITKLHTKPLNNHKNNETLKPDWIIEKQRKREALLYAQKKSKVFNDFFRPTKKY
jgi:sec-independent protein translocase protein TatC